MRDRAHLVIAKAVYPMHRDFLSAVLHIGKAVCT